MKQNSIRLARLLTMLPWLSQQGQADVNEISRIFDISEKEVLTDLALLTFVGPDQAGGGLVDIQYTKEHVKVIDSQGLESPLTLNEFEIISLVMGLKTLQDLDISNSATVSALEKLEQIQRQDAKLSKINLDLNSSINDNLVVEIEYLKYAENSLSLRSIEPHSIELEGASLMLQAWCLKSDAWRRFRLDRIISTRVTNISFKEREIPDKIDESSFSISLELDPSAKWILQQFGLRADAALGNSIELVLPVHSRSWLLRFLAASAFKIKKVEMAPAEREALLATLDLNIERLRIN